MDFGDVIFFIVFVIIIISNIMKQLKKAGKQTSEEDVSGKQPVKKTGWKNMLEEMLEEARKQMENKAEPESAGRPLKHPTGWEDLITEKEPVKRQPETRPAQEKIRRQPKEPIINDDPLSKKTKFRPECMECNASMKEITDFGIPGKSGLIYCDSCGEQHKYQILNGELKLKRAKMKRKSVIVPERRFKAAEKQGTPGKGAAEMQADAVPPVRERKERRQMSREDLRNAVVWSEILGKPLGLRDLEG